MILQVPWRNYQFVLIVFVSKFFFENMINIIPILQIILLQIFIFSLDIFLEFLAMLYFTNNPSSVFIINISD